MCAADLRVLLVEDSADDTFLIVKALRAGGFAPQVRRVETAAELQAALAEHDWDLALSDYNLPQFSGAEALEMRCAIVPELPFIVISGCVGEEAAVGLMRSGADDYVMKDNLVRLAPAVERCLKEAHNRRQRQLAQLALRESEARYRAIVTNIPGMVFQLLRLPDGALRLPYASDGCMALLEVGATQLMREPAQLVERIDPRDRAEFHASMTRSSQSFVAWNWEGRVKLASGETKWINLRSSPRALQDGSIQWGGIISNISHTKTTEHELRTSRERLRELSAHMQSVKERERTRIAREIHDDLGGTLTAIKIEVLRLARQLPEAQPALREIADSIATLADNALDTTRRISTELRPGILDLGLVAALEWQATEFAKRFDIGCAFDWSGEEITLDADVAFALFRIFQEALTNVVKHAGATHVQVGLTFGTDEVELSVRDDGRGLEESDLNKPRSFGIRGILERARDLGGEARLDSVPGRGTALIVQVPAPEAKLAAAQPQLALFTPEEDEPASSKPAPEQPAP